MSNVVSPDKLDANRRNAERSTGPRSSDGKSRSAANALKHGLLARNVVLLANNSPEKPDEFNRLLEDLVDDFQPANVLEQTLVERVATCYWRLHRAQRYEVEALQESIAQSPEPPQDLIDNLTNQIRHCDETTSVCHRILPLLNEPPGTLTAAQVDDIHQGLLMLAQRYPDVPTGRDEDRKVIRDRMFSLVESCAFEAAQLGVRLCALQRDRAPDVHRKRMDAALPRGDNLSRVVRYETMLDRQFHRALAELRAMRRVKLNVADPSQDNPRAKPAVAETRAKRKTPPAAPCAESDTM